MIVVMVLVCGAGACALNRPEVKSLRDPGADRIQFDTPIVTTVSALNEIPSRCGPAKNHRLPVEEFRVYQVVGRISRVRRERDHDVHIVLADLTRPRDHMSVELKDPDFRGTARSPRRGALAEARRMFDVLVAESRVQPLSDLKGKVVRVTGVGFFDINHFQIGRSRSCLELHPVLAIERVMTN